MIDVFKKLAHKEEINDDLVVYLSTLREHFHVECLIEGRLWVAHDLNPDENNYCNMHFGFFEFSSYTYGDPEDKIELSCLMSGHGPTGALKECRHTYWGIDGYIFYPNAEHIKEALDWLSKHYDVDRE